MRSGNLKKADRLHSSIILRHIISASFVALLFLRLPKKLRVQCCALLCCAVLCCGLGWGLIFALGFWVLQYFTFSTSTSITIANRSQSLDLVSDTTRSVAGSLYDGVFLVQALISKLFHGSAAPLSIPGISKYLDPLPVAKRKTTSTTIFFLPRRYHALLLSFLVSLEHSDNKLAGCSSI